VLEAVECNPDNTERFGLMLWAAASQVNTAMSH